ncbi:hypothetical protein EON66_00260 [archaeon]|nr:MAG: hypothetical protein EON66_00260 [archaeon]
MKKEAAAMIAALPPLLQDRTAREFAVPLAFELAKVEPAAVGKSASAARARVCISMSKTPAYHCVRVGLPPQY